MKKILAILIALLAALAVQTVAFADGEMMPLQPASTQSEMSSGTAVSVGDPITVDEINYTVLTVPSGGETGTVEVVEIDPEATSPSLRPSQMVKILTPSPASATLHFQSALA